MEEFKQEMETFRMYVSSCHLILSVGGKKSWYRTVESEKKTLLNITEKFKSGVQNLDYENYKKKIEDVCKTIDIATELFIVRRYTFSILFKILKTIPA